jgi:Tfp pilus assembly protein PilN
MTELIGRLLRRQNAAGYEEVQPRHWRRVPRVNLLPHARAGSGRSSLLRVALIAIVILGIVYVAVQYQGRTADEAAMETAKTRLQAVQRDLAAEQTVIEELQGQVDAARKRVDEASAGYEQIDAARTNWYGGVSNLLSTRIEGVKFTSVAAGPGGVIELNGVADDLGAMSRFQSRLRDVSQSLALRNISFESTSMALSFTATLRVVE